MMPALKIQKSAKRFDCLDGLNKNGNYLEALKYYQQSMVAFEYEFNDTSILSNPTRFEQGFTSFELFESLYLKAGCWEELYRISGDSFPFTNAINCYQSTYLLGDFIRTSFDNEEARLFLGKKVMKAYQQGIALVLDDYKATKMKVTSRLLFLGIKKQSKGTFYFNA